MTYEEAKKLYGTKMHKPYNDEEHRIQCACVNWFRLEYHRYEELLFAIPNGGQRDAVTGARLKAEGVLAGVADLFLAVPSNGYHGLWIEMKTNRGRQSPSQKEFEENIKEQGYHYVVCRGLTEFVNVIIGYLRYG